MLTSQRASTLPWQQGWKDSEREQKRQRTTLEAAAKHRQDTVKEAQRREMKKDRKVYRRAYD